MIVVPYKPEHLTGMVMQPSQEYLRGFITPEIAAGVANVWAMTGMVDGKVIGCAGLMPVWEHRAVAWTYLSKDAGPHMLAVTRTVRRMLDNCGFRRVELAVDEGFSAGHVWAKMLGFKLEAEHMRAYRPDGGNCSLYARITA